MAVGYHDAQGITFGYPGCPQQFREQVRFSACFNGSSGKRDQIPVVGHAVASR